jgi:SNF2 family DNA or RNA helicase
VTSREGGEAATTPIVQKLHRVLRPFMLRRLKAQVEHSVSDATIA